MPFYLVLSVMLLNITAMKKIFHLFFEAHNPVYTDTQTIYLRRT